MDDPYERPWALECCPNCGSQVFEKLDEDGTPTYKPIPMYLPMKIGGNVVLLTQLFWPTVHPALQETGPERDRRLRGEIADQHGLMPIDPQLLQDACGLHGFYDGDECPVCVALRPTDLHG